MTHYILEGTEPVAVDLMTWAKWLDSAGEARIVERTKAGGDVCVSTVFVGLEGGLFETMVFGGPQDGLVEKYPTWREAREGHHRWVEALK